MKAVGYTKSVAITEPDSLIDIELPKPEATGRDLLVRIEAVSVNPVDTKERMRTTPANGEAKILGWDGAGVVEAVGPEAVLFKAGDAVFYAGSIIRSGTNAEYHLVDERIVGPKPATLSFAEAAAVPLTTITAWEMLFDRFEIARGSGAGQAIVIIGGAGGVGSMAIQLARRLTGLTVIATASRPESRAWCEQLGAHHVVDHSQSLPDQLSAIGIANADYVFATTQTERNFPAIAEIVKPQGKVGIINNDNLDVRPLMRKSASLHYELMFTRAIFQTPDMDAQHRLLAETAALIDEGVLRTTLTSTFGAINAENLRRGHAQVESGRTTGKIVLAGF